MRLAILGLGLIGGSVARSLAERAPGGAWRITAWNRSPGSPQRALREGVIDDWAGDPRSAIRDADLVLLAATPFANLELAGLVGPALAGSGATLTDVSSVQGPIAAAAARVPGLRFVGGHPMAGREVRGYGAAEAGLFAGRPWVVLPAPAATQEDVERVEALARACGAVPRRMEPAEHDRLVAAISHLPLLVSAVLGETVALSPDWPAASELAAGGWRDATRLGRGDPELGAGIAAGNAAQILAWLSRFDLVLDGWRRELENLAAGATDGGRRDAVRTPEMQDADVRALASHFALVREALGRSGAGRRPGPAGADAAATAGAPPDGTGPEPVADGDADGDGAAGEVPGAGRW